MIKRLLIWNHKRFPDAFVVALGGFFMGGPFYLAASHFLSSQNPALFGVCVAIGAGYVAVKNTSPGKWTLPAKNEDGKDFVIETEFRIPLLQEKVKIFEPIYPDAKTSRNVTNISVNNNMIYITLSSSGIYTSETYKVSRFDISS